MEELVYSDIVDGPVVRDTARAEADGGARKKADDALDIADALQMVVSALRLASDADSQERCEVLEQVEARLSVIARVAEACSFAFPVGSADPRMVLLPLVRRFAIAAERDGLSIRPTVEVEPGMRMTPRKLLALGMLIYELLDGLTALPTIRSRCTGLKLYMSSSERGARLDLRFEEDASCAVRSPELFVGINHLATDLLGALVEQLDAKIVIGCDGEKDAISESAWSGPLREILRIDGICCA